MTGFGERFKQCRGRLGLSQQELAERAGVRVATISDWEREASTPQVEQLSRLADLFSVSTDWLLGRTARRSS